MSKRIVVTTGEFIGQSYTLRKTITRIGSSAECDICISTADIAPHALTLEHDGDSYLVYNKGESTIQLGNQQLKQDETVPWKEGVSLQLTDATTVRLEDDSRRRLFGRSKDLTPPAAGTTAVADTADNQQETQTNQAALWAVIVGFLVIAGAMFLLKFNVGSGTSVSDEEAFLTADEFLQELSNHTKDPFYGALHDLLAAGYRCEFSDDKNGARQYYTTATRLVSERSIVEPGAGDDAGSLSVHFESDLDNRTLNYISRRLDEL